MGTGPQEIGNRGAFWERDDFKKSQAAASKKPMRKWSDALPYEN